MPVYTPGYNAVSLHLGQLHVENDHCNYRPVKCLAKLQHMMEFQINSYCMHAQKSHGNHVAKCTAKTVQYVQFTVIKHIPHKYHFYFVSQTQIREKEPAIVVCSLNVFDWTVFW